MKKYETMVAINRKTSERKENVAIEAMRKLYELREPVSVHVLVEETGLSRGFYYKNERVHTELRRLQKLQDGTDFHKIRRAVLDKALALRIKELEDENRQLKIQIQDLLDKNSKLEKVAEKRKEDFFNEL